MYFVIVFIRNEIVYFILECFNYFGECESIMSNKYDKFLGFDVKRV